MLLAVDIGNTHTALGVFDGANLVADFRLRSTSARTADEWAALLISLLGGKGLSPGAVLGVAVASVVPPVGEAWRDLARRYLRVEPLVVAGDMDTGMPIRYHPPSSVGADRIANAVAVRALWGAPHNVPCVVVDYGTATKLEAVSADGVYLGGAILPGVGISQNALFAQAALLPRVPLRVPVRAIGTNTAEALSSGILLGFASQTDGLVARFVAELGPNTRVIATGGFASLIAPHAKTIELVEPHLTLIGLRLLHERVPSTPA